MKIEGTPVVDATKKIQIHISPQDVRQGKKKNPDACAAALACARQIDGATAAKVYRTATYVRIGSGKNAKWLRFRTPNSIRSEIISFDRGAAFEPGDYLLSPVQPSQEFGARRGRAESSGSGKQSRGLRPRHVPADVREMAPYRHTGPRSK